jgi:nitrogen-specific signal transduction histidine kinase/ActR/RegA family two-component response regulator
MAQDVTERHRLEEQLRQAQKMEAVGRLAGGIAHDFNNLLTVISGYTDFLLEMPLIPDPAQESLREVQKAAERAAALTRQLLAFSRRQVLVAVVLDLNAVVTRMDRMLHRLIGEDVQLVSVLAPDLGLVRADSGQIEQVLLNLAINARDAMPRGGQLSLETRNLDVDLTASGSHGDIPAGRYVVLTVRDNGCGMAESTRAQIFEPFFTTKGPGHGTGLGLATVYGIVKQSGGHIEVKSQLDAGTSFHIYLPRLTEAGVELTPIAPRGRAEGGTETLLLVEDEDSVRALVREVLRQEGYTVLAACNGREGIELCEQSNQPIDLVITDVVMPEMGGRELVGRLATLQPGIKCLFMSGYTDDSLLRQGIQSEGASFLQKPFTPADLSRKVREALAPRS